MHPDLDDASRDAIAGLDEATRVKLGERWQRRAQAELETGIFFAQLAPRVLREVREPAVLRLVTGAISEELQHAELCLEAARHYLGHELDWPTPRTWEEPAIEGVAPELETALLLISMCCINETLASAYLRACHQAATVPLARRTLKALLSDEIHHGQVGWAYLAPRVETLREPLGRYLPMLLDFNLKMWRARIQEDVAQPQHGYPDAETLQRELDSCRDQVIVAGFRHLFL